MREAVLSKLKQTYGLKEKHLMILRVLADAVPLEAEAIARKTQIPLSRLYAYLNDLVGMQLVQRGGRKPYRYVVPNFNRGVIDFMRSRMSDYLRTESEVMGLMKDQHEHIDLIKTREEYTRAHLNVIEESKSIRLTCFHRSFPFVLYPDDFDEFVHLRKCVMKFRPTISHMSGDAMYIIFRAYQQALSRGAKFEIIVEKWTILDHFDMFRRELEPAKYAALMQHMEKRLKRVNIRLIEEYLPMQIDVGDNMVVLALSHLDMATGIVSRSGAVNALYSTLFDQKYPRTKSLAEFVKGRV